MIDKGNNMIFPDAWAQGPPDPPPVVPCPECGEDMTDRCESCDPVVDEFYGIDLWGDGNAA